MKLKLKTMNKRTDISFIKCNESIALGKFTNIEIKECGNALNYAELNFHSNSKNYGDELNYADLNFNSKHSKDVKINPLSETELHNADTSLAHSNEAERTHTERNKSPSEEISASNGISTGLQAPFWRKRNVQMFSGLVFVIICVALIAEGVIWNRKVSAPEIEDRNAVATEEVVSDDDRSDVEVKQVQQNGKVEHNF